MHIFVRFIRQSFFNASTHSGQYAHIKGHAAVVLHYVIPASAQHERHDTSPASQYSPAYFTMTALRTVNRGHVF